MAFPTSKTSGFRHIRSMAAPPHVVGLLNHHPPPTRLALPRQQTQAIKVACEACRKRKGKCTGERPSCRFCNERGYKCEYDSEPMQTRSQALRRQNEILRRCHRDASSIAIRSQV
ncbi:Filamentous growth regulator 27 like protein [Verticillium longisporum]|nr:Filamentous growth regulator 27 like protein [Verticillium longisporum]KAG7149770.1 Filamentous growth regulator 27 like protein [Verticillium longisporum]